jgi:DNA replication and repair protein RecF
VHVSHLSLHNFRSYATAEVPLEAGVTAFIGRNGQGKTNLVEAIDYLSRLESHRVATDAPLIKQGADQAVVRAAVVRDGRSATLEIELNPGRANRARINKSPVSRTRDLIGLVRTVIFSPEDLALVKGDPSERRRFMDDLLMLRTPRLAGTKSDYDRVLRQRNSLLKTAGVARGSAREAALGTLLVWDEQLARLGAELTHARLELVAALRPYLGEAYATVAKGSTRDDAKISYAARTEGIYRSDTSADSEPEPIPTQESIETTLLLAIGQRRNEELARGITLVGPHRDELICEIGTLPVKGYASHGESWSFALALRLASYDLLRAEGDDPILILDDVFAELDAPRREQLGELVAGAEQVLVTAAVAEDVPKSLGEGMSRYRVSEGEVSRES